MKLEQTKLEAKNLTKTYSGRRVVDGVNLSVSTGEIVGLLGPNGAGKTTSFYMMVGLIRVEQGKIYLGGRDITQKPLHKRSALGVGYLPQSVSIFRKLSVADNLRMVMEIVGIPSHKREAKLSHILERFRLGHIEKSLGLSLSGGERRRVEIARNLIANPSILLLDEPFAGIDPVTVEDLQGVIKNLKDEGVGILITDHSVRETLGICDRAYVLVDGKTLVQGSPEEIIGSKKVQSVYLGGSFSL